MKSFCILPFFIVCVTATSGLASEASQLLSDAGIQGGLVVHVGCGDSHLTAGFHASEAYLVHGLDADPEMVATARQYIRSVGLYGKVSIDLLSGSSLPYADNLVNLLVVDRPTEIAESEMRRVLVPGGVALIKTEAGRKKIVKIRSNELDEWTHHLHNPDGNPVSRDTVVGPPQHLQWTDGPVWARSHGYTPSVTAMVSSGGRLFAIVDETLNGAGDVIPSRWFLVARDAFNGVVLWKKPVSNWGSLAMSGTADTGGGISVGRFTMPTHAGRRLVAVDDSVYVTLGADAPVTALDAASGEVQKVYMRSERADEVLISDGRLIVTVNPTRGNWPDVVAKEDTPPPAPGKRIRVFDLQTGELQWEAGPFDAIRAGRSQDPFGRLELVAGDQRVFFLTSTTIDCYAIESGEQVWQVRRPGIPEDAVRRLGFSGMYEFRLEVLVYHDGVVLLAQPEPNTHHTYHTMPGTLHAFDAANGKQMWSHAYGGWGHQTPPDVFVVGDTVWTHVDAEAEFGSCWGGGFRAKDPGVVDYRIQGLDLRSGQLEQELSTKEIFNEQHHHRCYRNRSTERFLMASRRGVEFVDLETGENWVNHWVRSGCKVGNLPCNGLIYVAPHPCGCYINAKLTGFNSLAPAQPARASVAKSEERLVKGTAYGASFSAADFSPSDWPTYRHDPQRSGATEQAIPADLKIAWQANTGTTPSAPVVADGKVFVAGVDTHSVHALNADDGKMLWSCLAGARVQSPPTYYRGLSLFGAADGCVYCVRASDGTPVWRFQAAPEQRLVSSYGQLESAWPVPGVLVRDDACWFAAGRSSYLDDGIYVYSLDPITGNVLQSKKLYNPDPETRKTIVKPQSPQMAGVLNDIPGSDGRSVFLRQLNISSEAAANAPQHLFTTAGYLDSSWFNRTFWKAGRAQTTGLMVLGDDVAYGIEPFTSSSRDVLFLPERSAYQLRCLTTRASSVTDRNARRTADAKKSRKTEKSGIVWEEAVGIRVTALVRAADTLFLAGSPDIVDPADPHGAWEGRKGGLLAAYSTSGQALGEIQLPAPPVWDGMAAANGRLYLSLTNGTVICLSP